MGSEVLLGKMTGPLSSLFHLKEATWPPLTLRGTCKKQRSMEATGTSSSKTAPSLLPPGKSQVTHCRYSSPSVVRPGWTYRF